MIPPFERATLKGLTGVEVIVENIRDAEKDGLERTVIQADVELRLRQSGVRVLSRDERSSVPGDPYSYVKVSTFKPSVGLGLYAFHTDVALTQRVRLDRDPKVVVFATTWSSPGKIGTVGADNVRILRSYAQDLVDTFLNAWLSVNAK